MRTKITRQPRQGKARANQIVQQSIWDIHPSPENDQLYHPIDPHDPSMLDLAEHIRKHGVIEPIIIDPDGWIASGHRRYTAARLAGLEFIPCRIITTRRLDDLEAWVAVLREHNRQRVKTNDELLREAVVDADPELAHAALIRYREEKRDISGFPSGQAIPFTNRRSRNRITKAKRLMLDAAKKVISERESLWPLTVRQIHYGLLNDPPLKHAKKPDSRYGNNLRSYKNLCELLSRARLVGEVSWRAITDETRPVFIGWQWPNIQDYLHLILNNLFLDYARDLQRSQPRHIELVVEKMTVQNIVHPIAAEYTIPMTVGRGYCSLAPRKQLVDRFLASGKDRLIVLICSDHDPDGQGITESFVNSLCKDFRLAKSRVEALKIAITSEQIRELKLPTKMTAKQTSSRYKRFLETNTDDSVFELEALEPAKLQGIVRDAIRSVLDIEAFNRELEAERQDAAFLQVARQRAVAAIGQVGQ